MGTVTNEIGLALWEFIGDFGILNSGRTDVEYQDWYGYKLDKRLLALMQSNDSVMPANKRFYLFIIQISQFLMDGFI